LTYAVWGDNNFVKTLSNFHSPVILRGGMRRNRRNPQTKRRERDFSDVDCPTQQKTYCTTYHKIDKGNGAEAMYDIISTESYLRGWPPKLAARYFNMNSNNAYKVYVCLHNKHHRGRDPMNDIERLHKQFDTLPTATRSRHETERIWGSTKCYKGYYYFFFWRRQEYSI
jgi:hypothetical protein